MKLHNSFVYALFLLALAQALDARTITAELPICCKTIYYEQHSLDQTGLGQIEQKKYTTLFSHGLGSMYDQAYYYYNRGLFCQPCFATFNYIDAPEGVLKRNTHTGLAQASEIACMRAAYEKTIALQPDGIVLYGISRGSSTIINMVAQCHQEGIDLSLIKAIILESPFADAEDTLATFATRCKVPLFFARFLVKRIFKEYDRYQNKPIDAVRYLPSDIPILFVCLQADAVVPYASTLRLYEELKKHERDNVYLLSLFGNGFHANLPWAAQGHTYYPALQTFYQIADLPYDVTAAKEGTTYLV